MATTCYAMVRGSAIRVTGLGRQGQLGDPIQYAVSKSVAKVTINEVIESASNEILKTDDGEPRLHLVRNAQIIRYTVDVDFLRVDPGVLSLVTGVPSVIAPDNDFGEGGFGLGGFGGGDEPLPTQVVGFDSDTKRAPAAFALEVWSKLAGGSGCSTPPLGFDEGPFSETPFGSPYTGDLPQYGYTLFPFLKGGRLSGFSFKNGLVSFNLRGAQTRKVARWGVGPYDLEGTHERLLQVVSRNSMWQNFVTHAAPPTEACGIQETEDVIYGGDAFSTSSDVIDGEFVVTSPWIIEGGRAV